MFVPQCKWAFSNTLVGVMQETFLLPPLTYLVPLFCKPDTLNFSLVQFKNFIYAWRGLSIYLLLNYLGLPFSAALLQWLLNNFLSTILPIVTVNLEEVPMLPLVEEGTIKQPPPQARKTKPPLVRNEPKLLMFLPKFLLEIVHNC